MNKRTLRALAVNAACAVGCLSPADGLEVPHADGDSQALQVAETPASDAPAADLGGDSEPTETTLQVQPAPPGFPPTDEFADLATACAEIVPRQVDREDLHGPILDWCLVRAHASSRNGRVRSRIDGSWIHDRDRPAARSFYLAGLRAGSIDPDTCPHHAVDRTIKRSRDAAGLVERWPYGTHCDRSQGECRPTSPGRMRESVADRWLDHAPDYERFGTRGPMDNHFATAARLLGGCFGPEQLDRFDVAAAVVIARAEELCERLEHRLATRARREAAKRAGLPTTCRTSRDIRAIWSPGFWSDALPAVTR